MSSDLASEAGPSRYRLSMDRRAASAEQRGMRRDLMTATAEGRFLLQFQPRMPLRSGRRPAAEAMLRWPHRKRGLMSPTAFMPMAEQTGQVVEIGGWALRQACQDAASWPNRIGVSLNVSARQLGSGVLADQVATALGESGLDPEQLELELHESLLVDADIEMTLTLSAIRDLGVGLAIDEFGSGLASVASLKRLPLTAIKLDRSLVRDLPENAEDAAILRAIVSIGHVLGMTVTAEGVETDAQLRCLIRHGCDEAQGHLFSQPVEAAMLAPAIRGAVGRA